MNDECSAIINKVKSNKNLLYSINVKFINRYCSQNNFSVLIGGGVVRNAFTIQTNKISTIINFPQIEQAGTFTKQLCIKGEIYAFGGYDDSKVKPVEKYSPVTKT